MDAANIPDSPQQEKTKKSWKNKRCLTGIIITSVLILILLAVLLPVLLTGQETNCSRSICTSEAARIRAQIDPAIDPCDDFYQFACGNYLKSNNTVTFEPFKLLLKQAEREIVQLYNTPIDENDHYMVKLTRRLFKACMNTTEIERESLRTFKKVLKLVGGWPIIEGADWNESNFDWLKATYKLRELGYPFSIFLDLKVGPDPRNSTGYILEVRIPYDIDEASEIFARKKGIIRKVALAFGADIDADSQEIKKLHMFGEKVFDQMLDHTGLPAYPIHTVEELQKNLGFINWLEFINNISGPAVKISNKEPIMVVEAHSLRQRFDLLSKTPKRTQANYMMWKLIQHMIPYLTQDLQKMFPEDKPKEARFNFCIKEIQRRFEVSPIDVLYARKYLSRAKRKGVEELVTNMKETFLNEATKTKWMAREDKQIVEDKASDLAVVVGEPGDYFDDGILDSLNTDMKEMGEGNFLNLLSQLSRNYLSHTFCKIKKSHSQMKLYQRDMFPLSQDVHYYPQHNLLRVSASQLQDQIFNADRPNYINYGILGKELGKEISSLMKLSASYFDKDGNRIGGWMQESAEGFGNITGCLIRNMDGFKQLTFDFMIIEMQADITGTKLAYESYKNWIKSNRQEPKLGDMEYSPVQLFWVSTVSCYPNNTKEHPLSYLPDSRDLPRNIVYATMRNSPQFSKDFNCPVGSPMNPANKCEIF